MHCKISLAGGMTVLVRGNALTGEVDFLGVAATDPKGLEDVRQVAPELAVLGEAWVERNQHVCRQAMRRTA